MALAPNKILAEFLGTFLLVLTITLNTDSTWSVLSIAAVLMVCIYAMGPVSGGHFNPAVTLAIALNKGIDTANAVMYVVAQFAAAVLARYLTFAVYGRWNYVHPSHEINILLAEMTYTFMLVYVVLNVACRKEPNQAFGLAIGGVIVAGGYAAGKIGGGAFNPAVATLFDTSLLVFYILGELVGSCLAWFVFKKVVYKDGAAVTTSAKLASEFIGTFMLVTTACLCVMMDSPAPALSIGFALACMIFADGGVSGGNFNPMVTMACYFRGSVMSDSDANTYLPVQLLAGFCGGSWASVVAPFSPSRGLRSFWILSAYSKVTSAGTDLQVSLEECVGTLLLCLVVLGVATVAKPASSVFNGLTVGLCIVAGGTAAGTSGGHLNPSVTLGMFFADPTWRAAALAGLQACMMYIAGQGLGCFLAVAIFRVVFRDEFAASAREYKVLPGDA